ncbi:MAG: hypothetical protein GTO18_17205 [Anaerolineales bacterium]|nr:hypothetical protein [Anaerolineales bacterium]
MKKDMSSTLLRFRGPLALLALAASLLLGVTLASGQTPTYVPGNAQGMFVVENAWAQFVALKHHGEALAWTLPEHLGAPDPNLTDHYQGLVRYPGGGVPVFYVTQKDTDDGGKKGGYLHVVIFLSRPTNGERLRSNLLEKGKDTEDTYPPFTSTVYDSWYRSIRFDGLLHVDSAKAIDPTTKEPITVSPYTLPAYEHPGGMAIVDDILFVPLDTPDSSSAPTGFIVLFDLRDNQGSRENPKAIHAIALDHNIDNLAVTKYDFGDGEGTKYLVWVNGAGGSVTKFYKTSSSDLRDPELYLEMVQIWNPHSTEDISVPDTCWIWDDILSMWVNTCWPQGTCAHQSSTLLRDTGGSLYMIGMRHAGICWSPSEGTDHADLYWVEPKIAGGFKLTYLGERDLYCAYDGGGGPEHMRICNFGAAGNAYVSPSGELILYSIPHEDEDGKDPDFVRLGEFRHRDVNYTRTCTLGAGWAELYAGKNFSDRSIVFDWPDRDQDDFDNFNILDGFNDKTSSVRWCAPVGCNIILYEHDSYGGAPVTLPGLGEVAGASDLGGFDDEASSIRFYPNPICENPFSFTIFFPVILK